VFSIVKSTDFVVVSVNLENAIRMARQIDTANTIDTNELIKVVTPKNIDIISFVNDMAMRGRISAKYVVSSGIED
jgi:hypothetical protein